MASNAGVYITSKTWSRDSHDLFDFESGQTQMTTHFVKTDMKCIRQGTEVQMLDVDDQNPPQADVLLTVKEQCGKYWVDKPSVSSLKKLWLVVRDLKNTTSEDGYSLSVNDVIRLGRFKFRVKQLVASPGTITRPDFKLLSGNRINESCIAKVDGVDSTICRICLTEGATEDDPLIAPCECKGSIEHVHLKCLRHWIKGRMNIADGPTASYFLQPLHCELCKGTYPMYVDSQDGAGPSAQTTLMEIPEMQAPFIVLENQVRDSHLHANRGLHVLSLAGKPLHMGRGHDCDVRIADVSISRHHATIRYHDGQFLLQDNKSKFGTSVAVKKSQMVESTQPISLQIGRTVVSLSTTPPEL